MFECQYLKVNVKNHICTVTLNNPKKSNSINETMWYEIKKAFDTISAHPDIKVCLIKSDAKHFSSGIDINFLDSIMEKLKKLPEQERSEVLYQQIKIMQASMNAIADCSVPVIAAIHGICVGGAVDLISACDIRLSTYTSIFSILETKLGIVADMGTLQRLPRIISDSNLKELALTSDFFSGFKAKKIGLVSGNSISKKRLHLKAYKLANKIAKLPSHAVKGTKTTINFAKDNSTSASLEQIAKLNSELLLSEQTVKALEDIKKKLAKK